jgi:hypothetical protein
MTVLTVLVLAVMSLYIGGSILFSSMIDPDEELDSIKAWKDLNAKESSIPK